MIVREFVHADVYHGYLECLRALAEVNLSEGEVLDIVRERSRCPNLKTLVAESEVTGNVLGTLSLLIEPKIIHGRTVGHIEDVVVHPDWNGEGIGSRLVKHAIEVCRQEGCYKMLLHCRTDLLDYYARFGFKEVGHAMRLDLTNESVSP